VVKLLGVGVTVEVRLHGFDLDLLRGGVDFEKFESLEEAVRREM
jgi:hypothetical protein